MTRRLEARTLTRPSSTRIPAALALLLLLGVGLACAAPGSSSAPPELVLQPTVQPAPAEAALATPVPPASGDIVFYNGVVLTVVLAGFCVVVPQRRRQLGLLTLASLAGLGVWSVSNIAMYGEPH